MIYTSGESKAVCKTVISLQVNTLCLPNFLLFVLILVQWNCTESFFCVGSSVVQGGVSFTEYHVIVLSQRS